MKKILKEYINKMENGLFILDAPTGFGKTRSVVDYIKESIDITDKKRYFFITNLKKNLPFDSFNDSKYENQVLFLKPNYQNVLDVWKNVIITDQRIINSEEYKNLANQIDLYNRIKNTEKIYDKKILLGIEEQIEKNYEPKFRDLIKKNYFYNKTHAEKNKYISKNDWLKKFYPAIELGKYKVVLLTTNKFVSPIDPLYKLPYFLYEDDILKDTVIFIDEFDATKNTILDVIIRDGLKAKVDIIKLFIHIYLALENNGVPSFVKNLERVNKERGENNYYNAKQLLCLCHERFKDIYDKYKLNYVIKTKDINDDKSFIFNDGTYISITKDNQRKNLLTCIDKEEEVRKVYTSKYLDGEKITDLIKEIEYEINYFVNAIKYISEYYQGYKNTINDKNKDNNYTTLDDALHSILSLFNLDEKEKDYLVEIIKLSSFKKEKNLCYDLTDGFLKTGLEIIEIEDSDYHDLQSIFYKYKFKITPEEILYMIAKMTIVIGISATGTLDTKLANYDLNYLKNKLGDNFYELDKNNFNRLKHDFLLFQKQFKNDVNITVNIVDNYDTLNQRDICKKIIENIVCEEKKNEYLAKLENTLDKDIYYFSLLLKIGYAYKKFIENEKLYSFLCFLNSSIKFDKNQNGVKYEDLKELCDSISNKECEISCVSSYNFDEEMEAVYGALEIKKKCFVITTYQTLGSGKNIQYKIPTGIEENMKIINKSRWEKDFDGILLIAPTNLIQNLDFNSKDKYFDISKFIFQQEYLYKRHHDNNKLLSNISFGFKKIFFSDAYAPINNSNSDLYMTNARMIIQAVGRICRSPNKNKETLIITEKEVVERLNIVNEILEKRLLNSEFEALLSTKIVKPKSNIETFDSVNKAASEIINSKAWIVRRSKEDVEEWKKIRELVLKNPTYKGNIEPLDKLYFDFIFDVNSYLYKQEYKKIVDICFEYRENYNKVSMHEAELDSAISIGCVEDYFKKHGYATKFKKANKMMMPALFKQIYIGALGEVVGKAILDSYLGIELKDIDDYSFYEFFDYKIGDVYIDFKNWKTFRINNRKQVKKISKKLEKVNGSKAIIINIFKRGYFKNYTMNLPKNIIQIPWIINEENKVDVKQIGIIKEFIQNK